MGLLLLGFAVQWPSEPLTLRSSSCGLLPPQIHHQRVDQQDDPHRDDQQVLRGREIDAERGAVTP